MWVLMYLSSVAYSQQPVVTAFGYLTTRCLYGVGGGTVLGQWGTPVGTIRYLASHRVAEWYHHVGPPAHPPFFLSLL